MGRKRANALRGRALMQALMVAGDTLTAGEVYTLARQVEAGGRFLDKAKPGWAERIDLDKLRLENGDSCVLGQLDGDYAHVRDELFNGGQFDPYSTEANEVASTYGFYVMPRDGNDEVIGTSKFNVSYEVLNRLWPAEVAARI